MPFKKEDTIASGLIAVLPSLIQLVAIASESIKNMLGLSNFLYTPSSLSFLNFLSFFVSLSTIGIINLFQKHPRYIIAPREMASIREAQESGSNRSNGIENTKNVTKRKVFVALGIIMLISITCFLATVTLKISQVENAYLPFLQNISYILMLSSIAGILYSWHQSYLEQRMSFKVEDFIPNFKNALINSGLLSIVEPIILQNQLQDRGGQRYVRCKVNGRNMAFLVSIDGSEIQNSEETPAPTPVTPTTQQ